MTSILVAYGTGAGQTAKVADRIASVLDERGHDVTALPVSAASTVDMDDFDAVLVGSPINYQRHLPAVVEYVEENRETLSARPSGLFQLSLAPLAPFGLGETGDRTYVDELTGQTGWRPDTVGHFAGAIRYSQYDRPTRWLFRLVAALTTGDTDTSRDYEYTDWEAVERFADEFAEFVESRVAASSQLGRVRPRVGRRGAALVGLGAVGLAGLAYWAVGRRGRPGAELGAEPEAAEAAGTSVPITE
ncbi:MAG TPA: flavodoxin domain-containing protein [Halobacteriales archaeon]|nr:flavodoxin domain-containing protein [Halobacteriales archaeon]